MILLRWSIKLIKFLERHKWRKLTQEQERHHQDDDIGHFWLQFPSQKDQQETILTQHAVMKIPEPENDAETPTRQQDWERPSKDKNSCFTLTSSALLQTGTAPHLESLTGSTVSPVGKR